MRTVVGRDVDEGATTEAVAAVVRGGCGSSAAGSSLHDATLCASITHRSASARGTRESLPDYDDDDDDGTQITGLESIVRNRKNNVFVFGSPPPINLMLLRSRDPFEMCIRSFQRNNY